MSLLHADLTQRIHVENVKQYDILGYGADNLYPQSVKTIVQSSGRALSCIETLADYIEGNGFTDPTFYQAVINNDGETMDEILRKVSAQKAKYGGVSLLVKYNPFGEPVELYSVEFDEVRIGIGDHTGQFAVYDNWDRLKSRQIKKADIEWYNQYDPTKALEQIDNVGFNNYKGQLLYLTTAGANAYCYAPIDSELETCVSDAQIKMSHYGMLTTGFMATTLITLAQALGEDDREDLTNTLTTFQGGDNSGQLLVLDGIAKEDINISDLSSKNADAALEKTELSVSDRIRRRFKIPPILLGDKAETGFSDSGEFLRQSKAYYSEMTNKERRFVEELMTMIFKDWAFVVNPSGNYSITPIVEPTQTSESVETELLKDLTQNERRGLAGFEPLGGEEATESLLIETIGVGGVQALTAILADPTLSSDQKKNALIIVFGISDEDAQKLIS